MKAWWLSLLLLGWSCQLTAATSLDELLAAGRLQVDSKLTPTDSLVPGQRARLSLKIATDRWFAGGTRIAIPEVPGLVILQVEQFASNASENRGGTSWVVQRWTLDVYPQQAGDFRIPPIKMTARINTEDGEVEGELLAPAVLFSVSVPETLAEAKSWVAAPDFELSQAFDRSLEDLQPGDAFEREITFQASDVMAMMLPSFEPRQQQGLAAYPQPPGLEDNNNRGQTSARRVEKTSYVVEAPGHYILPEMEYFWWDTVRQRLTLLTLPETSFTVAGATPTDTADDSGPGLWQLAAGLAAALALGLLLWLLRKLLPPERLASWHAHLNAAWQWLRDLRKPALAERLNPGSNAGE
jgi:hypothetical protein